MFTSAIRFGSYANVDGIVFVLYYGMIIAIIDRRGKIITRNLDYPIYLVEYILSLPDYEKVKLN